MVIMNVSATIPNAVITLPVDQNRWGCADTAGRGPEALRHDSGVADVGAKLPVKDRRLWLLAVCGVLVVVATLDSLLFIDISLTKILNGDWIQHALIVVWGVNTAAAWIAARVVWRRAAASGSHN